MSNIEKLNELYRQLESCKSSKKKSDLQRGIYKLEKKIRIEKTQLKRKDNIYFQ